MIILYIIEHNILDTTNEKKNVLTCRTSEKRVKICYSRIIYYMHFSIKINIKQSGIDIKKLRGFLTGRKFSEIQKFIFVLISQWTEHKSKH